MNNSVETAELLKSKVINGTQADIFRAWTEPELLSRWWWPARFQTTFEVDLRVGGKWRFFSADLPGRGVLGVHGEYREIVPTERLVYTWIWESEDEYESLVTVDFIETDGKTEVVVHHVALRDETDREAHAQGWSDCLDRLALLAESGNMAAFE